ncbi:efflux transporter outer membrane subunit [Granulicella cerasi]|uniref:Efflux transporter outer membrane subunit n=2 Tax=Granulicella cerasi TaxID=741063 RepID=A0ABW1ZCG2_9BACT
MATVPCDAWDCRSLFYSRAGAIPAVDWIDAIMTQPIQANKKRGRKTKPAEIAGLSVASMLLLSGCMVGPHYKRPAVVAPPTYRDAELVTKDPGGQASVADLKWSEVFKDEDLKALLAEAIKNNYDVRIAAQRILEQQAQVGVTKAQMLPSANAGAAYSAVGIPSGLLGNETSPKYYGGGFTATAAWNLDFWGLYRRQNEAARAELLATEWGRRATLSSIVINVASAYVQLRALDAQLEITKATLDSRKASLRLVSLRERTGATTMADVHQAEQLLYAAESVQPQLESQIRQQENSLSLLLGRNPGPIVRGKRNTEQPHPEEIPTGIPSQLLERRPDIQRAEAELVAANARIGVARAQFFPQISLTALGGTSTSQLNKLFDSSSSYWLANGAISQPLFAGGRLKNDLKAAEATQQEVVVNYQKTIASAFRDVSNALIVYQKSKEDRIAQEKQTEAASQSVKLARLRYDNGRSSYLEVLTNDTNLFSAQLNLASVQEQEALSLVQLYAALGGGWQ